MVQYAETEIDKRQRKAVQTLERERAATAAAEGQGAAGKSDPVAKDRSRRRFKTFNTFVDAVGRYLQPPDRDVWHVLFRFADAETNVAEVRLADIAARLNCHTRTAKRSVDRLIKAGLVERLKRGTRQGGPSRYRIDPTPERHVERLRSQSERVTRPRSGPPRRESRRVPRDENGQFTT